MARSGSTGLPFLVRRPDAGQCTYHRAFAADLAPYVTGVVQLPWTRQASKLTGKKAVKLSLGTKDLAVARSRWTMLHPQVEALVGEAVARQALAREPSRGDETTAPRLSPEAIRAMAGHASHDILVDHDRSYTDRNYASPTAQVIARLLQKSVAQPSQGVTDLARHAEARLHKRVADKALASRNLSSFDREVETIELDLPPDFFDDIVAGRAKSLTDQQLERLARAETSSKHVKASDVDVIIRSNGMELPPDHPDRPALVLAILRARANAFDQVLRREAGEHSIETPPRPAAIVPAPELPRAAAKPKLSAMRERWLRNVRPTDKQADDNAIYLRYFCDLNGDLPVDQITPPMVASFLQHLLDAPRNAPHALRNASLQLRIAWANDPGHHYERRLSRSTINAKALGTISTLMTQAIKAGEISVNPCVTMALDVKDGDRLARQVYSLVDLRRILCSEIYTTPASIGKAGGGAAARWLPLLGLFTGARLEELGQLLTSDVKSKYNIPYIDITEIPDENDATPQNSTRDAKAAASTKRIKSKSGRRRVPIHAELVRCGFLRFVEQRRAAGSTRLFPELVAYRDRVTKDWSRFWARFTDHVVTNAATKTFHSFRHGFIGRLRALKVEENRIKALVGHALNDVTLHYGQEEGFAYDLSDLNDELQKFSIVGLDLGSLYKLHDTSFD